MRIRANRDKTLKPTTDASRLRVTAPIHQHTQHKELNSPALQKLRVAFVGHISGHYATLCALQPVS